ncbi:uncharacterized membrane protein YcaP (DUF421 family) [Metabacillus crassostreae]|uniref:YetF domain-containing protein n=1 Tax=Metabacillus crassostreae TaxID=929098 RepID=UPI00195EFF29|nr:DUF421 domain-containing protein [Metabacillus crassostreae]MBM7602360.1 uncharacterized membrane protein YcaP (DUF421 family) [Metabacillus crassostreae]
MSVMELGIRVLVAFLTLLIVTRIVGRKEISQITFFNFVSAIALGSIGANVAVNANLSLQNGILSIIGWGLITIIIGLVDIKSKKARVMLEGEPVIVIKDGQIMEQKLRQLRLDSDELKAMLRKKNVFSLQDVDYGIIEIDGNLSVMKKEYNQSVTKNDLNIKSTTPQMYPISTTLISDGQVLNENLSKVNLSEQWLKSQLQSSGITSISDIFIAELQKDGSLYIDKRNDTVH